MNKYKNTMRKKVMIYLMISLLFSGFQGMAQITAKGSKQSKKKPGEAAGTLPMDQTVFQTTRAEDIDSFDRYEKMFKNAVSGSVTEEAEMLRKELTSIMRREIARSKKNLEDLNAGKTKDLEAWHKEHAPDKLLNLEMEKKNLKNRISYQQAVLNKLIEEDLSNLSNQRDKTSVIGYLESFKKQMPINLKYGDVNMENPTPPPPPPKSGGEPLGGPAYTTKKGTSDKMETGDPRLQRWKDSQTSLTSDFLTGQSNFQKYLDAGNSKMAKTTFRSLIQMMMTAINSNNWLLGQMNAGNISKNGFDVSALQSKANKQQSILNEAQKIKVSTPEDLKANASQAVGVIQKFAGTLK